AIERGVVPRRRTFALLVHGLNLEGDAAAVRALETAAYGLEPESFGNLLARYRGEAGWSQEKFAALIGADPLTVRRWENHQATPDLDTRLSVAVLLDLSPPDSHALITAGSSRFEEPGSFAGLLRDRRAVRQLSQRELALKSGVGIEAISKLERGLRHPRP